MTFPCTMKRLAVSAMAGAVLAMGTLAPTAAFAISDETEAALSETQQQVEESAAAYTEARENLEEIEEQIAELEEQIAELEEELPAAQEAASEAMNDLYHYEKSTNSFLGLLLNSTSISEVITSLKYMQQIEEESTAAVEELNEMHAELEEAEAELEALQTAAEEEAEAAEEALAEAQALRKAAQEQAEAEEAAELAALAAAEAEAEAEAEEEEAAEEDADEEDEDEDDSSSSDSSSSSSSSSGTDSSNTSNTATDSSVSSVTTSASSGEVDWTLSYDEFIEEWTTRINAYLAGSPLAGYGKNFAVAAWTYGVDPRWSPAISCIESSKGKYCFKSYNAWGWGSVSWSSWEEAIDAHVNGLSRLYGTTLTTAAAKKYCPNTWQDWYNKVAAQMNKI